MRARGVVRAGAVFGLVAAGAATILGFFGPLWWELDLLSHFRVQYACVLIACGGAVLALRRRRVAAIAVVLTALNVAQFGGVWLPGPAVSPSGTRLRILMINVLIESTAYEKVAAHIREVDPDLLALSEIDDAWAENLEEALRPFPSRQFLTRDDALGIGLYSKRPFLHSDIRYPGDADAPTVFAAIDVEGRPVDIVFAHPPSPVNAPRVQRRDAVLAALAQPATRGPGRMVLIADFNTTPWSPSVKRLMRALDLRDSRDGFGIQASWPVHVPPMLIPIDGCLVSRAISVVERRLGPDVGSDHYPLYLELAL